MAARHKAFAQTEPWNCVLALSSAGDRHDVLEGVFPPNDAALEKAMAAWIDTQDATGEAIAKDVGTLVAAADEPLPTDPAKQSVRSDEDDAFQARLAMAIYRHTDGDLVDYDAFVTSHDLTGDTSAPFRYFNHVMDEGGPIADRLRGYASAIDEERDELRAR